MPLSEATLSGAFISLPTGFGKSLVYQVMPKEMSSPISTDYYLILSRVRKFVQFVLAAYTGRETWTLDWTNGLDCGMRFGLDFGLT